MNTAQEAEDALLLVSHMQRTILDNGVRRCFDALDNGGQTMTSYSVHTKHGLYREHATAEDVEEMTAITPFGLISVIEYDGWCGCYIDVEPCVVVEHGDALSVDARNYLNGE